MRIRRAIDRISHRGAEVAAIGTAGVGLFALGLDSDVSEMQRRFVWRLLTILAGLVVAISLTGFFYLKRQQTSARAHVYNNLNAIADLKMTQIGNLTFQKGTGLGLTIARQQVELMGGRISVESQPGKSSLFRGEVPVDRVEASEVAAVKIDRGRVVGLAPGQPESRILIVEDEMANWLLLRRLLEAVGFQVRVAENGAAGLELFQTWPMPSSTLTPRGLVKLSAVCPNSIRRWAMRWRVMRSDWNTP